MTPHRKTEHNGHKVEQYYWSGRFVTYLDNCAECPDENECERVHNHVALARAAIAKNTPKAPVKANKGESGEAGNK